MGLIHGDKAADVTGNGTQLNVQTEDEATTIEPEWVFDIEDEACSWSEKVAGGDSFMKSTSNGGNETQFKFMFEKSSHTYLEVKGGNATVVLNYECGELTQSPGTIIFRKKKAPWVSPAVI